MAKSTSRQNNLICPCCKKARDIEEGTPLPKQEAALRNANADPWKRAKGWSIESARAGTLQWACNACIKAKRAIEARPESQTFCDDEPYFAYIDVQIRCTDCGTDFVFGAKEQQYWYEQLKFWVQSRPKQCVPCRRARREKRAAEGGLESSS